MLARRHMLPVVHRSGEAPRTAQSEVSGDSLRSLSGGERRLPSVLQMACDDTALSGRSGRIVRHHGRHTSTPISKRSPLGLTRPVIRPRQARRSIPPQSLYQPFAGWHTGPQAVANRSVRARKDPVRLIEIGPHEVKPLTDLLRRMAFSILGGVHTRQLPGGIRPAEEWRLVTAHGIMQAKTALMGVT